jgi:hypothetical protein
MKSIVQSPIMAKTQRISSFLLSGCLLAVTAAGCGGYQKMGQQTAMAQKGDLAGCVGDVSTRNPAMKGKKASMTLNFDIAPDGSVANMMVTDDKLNDPALVDCLTQRTKAWRFPAPPSGKTEKFDYKINANVP